MSYPICSVVAVFKMLIRILNKLRSRIWDMTWFLFFCVLAPRGMNEIVFGERKGKRAEGRGLLYTRKIFGADVIDRS